MKLCSKCKIEKNRTEFNKYSRSKDGLNSYCRECSHRHRKEWEEKDRERAKSLKKAAAKRYRERNREKVAAHLANWYSKNADHVRTKNRMKNYGITNEEYLLLVRNHDSRCAICGMLLSGKDLHVDHDHKTGRVRGILCNRHNLGIGYFGDDIEMLKNAIEYLKK